MANQATKTHYIPAGYHTATPYLIVNGAAKALDWYKNVFGAQEELRFPTPDGKIGHAEIKIGDSHIMLADEYPRHGLPQPAKPSAALRLDHDLRRGRGLGLQESRRHRRQGEAGA